MSKKELIIELLKKYSDNFICPHCKKNLKIVDTSFTCENNHCFDINKKGYLCLTSLSSLPNSTIYTKELFVSRRSVINNGIYNSIHVEIIDLIRKYISIPTSILDIGSGESSHLNKICEKLSLEFKCAIDLAKDAIELSSDYVYNDIISLVADVENIPLVDNSIDVILDFLSPGSKKECKRILKENGIIIKVLPTANYLKEIRRELGHKEYDNEKLVEDNLKKNNTILETKKLEYTMPINKELSNDIVKMTPLTHNFETSKLNIKEITISLKILVLRPL